MFARDNPMKVRTSRKRLVELEQQCFENASHIISWTSRAAKSLSDDYGIPQSKISVIYPTVSPTIFELFQKAPKVERSDRNRIPRLLFVGNDFKRKGGEDLVNVYSEKLQGRFELDVVCGDEIDLPKIPGMRHLKAVTYGSEQWFKLFANADIFVLPTKEECFGLAFVEALSAGLPLIGTNVMAVPEIVRDGENGLVVSPGDRGALADKILLLGQDSNLRFRLGAGSQSLASHEFDPKVNAGRIARVFRDALSCGNR
jgi:glycosyltransferase involved in cell wall biosynthesis